MRRRWHIFRDMLLNNRGLKIASLLLAIVTWYAIDKTIDSEAAAPDAAGQVEEVNRVFEGVGVKALVDTARQRRTKLQPERITIELRGPANLLQGLASNDMQAFVDCSDIDKTGQYEREVRIGVPPGTMLLRADPAKVIVTVNTR